MCWVGKRLLDCCVGVIGMMYDRWEGKKGWSSGV